jgi:hypothetical protein
VTLAVGLLLALATAGCEGERTPPAAPPPPKGAEPSPRASAKFVAAGRKVSLEVEGKHRRVLVNAVVCLREGMLEQLMCRRGTKEHEAVLSADADARDIHKALLITGAKPGSTVRYEPRFQAPTGTPIRVTLRYSNDGKEATVPAQQWVRNVKTHQALDQDWVFAGSVFIPNPIAKDQRPEYAANGGEVICVSNFEGAMLDLPISSSKDNSELSFEAFTEHIPSLGTKVVVILEPIAAERKK